MERRVINPKASDSDLRSALARQDALRYATMCEDLGRTPEDPALYERGLAEREMFYKRQELEEISSSPSYREFFDEANSLGIDLKPLAQSDAKAGLLRKYFPKFRDDGSQPLSPSDPMRIGSIFRKVYRHARDKSNT